MPAKSKGERVSAGVVLSSGNLCCGEECTRRSVGHVLGG